MCIYIYIHTYLEESLLCMLCNCITKHEAHAILLRELLAEVPLVQCVLLVHLGIKFCLNNSLLQCTRKYATGRDEVLRKSPNHQ